MSWLWFLGPTWWKERTHSFKRPIHMYALSYCPAHTHPSLVYIFKEMPPELSPTACCVYILERQLCWIESLLLGDPTEKTGEDWRNWKERVLMLTQASRGQHWGTILGLWLTPGGGFVLRLCIVLAPYCVYSYSTWSHVLAVRPYCGMRWEHWRQNNYCRPFMSTTFRPQCLLASKSRS